MTDVLFLLLARSGSKGVPGKNIATVGGLPLLAYRILTSSKSKFPHDIVISTDSNKYAEIAKNFGARAPFLRPNELSSDTASSMDVCLHALKWLEDNEAKQYKYICLLEPTSPFTNATWIDEAIAQMQNQKTSSVVACRVTNPNTRFIQDDNLFLNQIFKNIEALKNLNRQAFKKQITPSGNFYISTVESFKKKKAFYQHDTLAYIIADPFGLEIDNEIELEWARFLIEKKFVTHEMLGID